jgi:hypothetical protein
LSLLASGSGWESNHRLGMDGAGLAPTAGRRKLKSSCHISSPYLMSRTDFRPVLHICSLFSLSLDFLTLTRDPGRYHTMCSPDMIFFFFSTTRCVYGLDWKDCTRLGKPRTHCSIFFFPSFGFVLHILPRPFGSDNHSCVLLVGGTNIVFISASDESGRAEGSIDTTAAAAPGG